MQEINSDKPVAEKKEDRFQRYEFSKRIAAIVSKPQLDKSIIMGLYGKWGEGKTTVMNFIQRELSNETIVINFNPWLFSDEHHLLNSFFDSIAEALNSSSKTAKEKIGQFLSDYAGAIGSVTQFVGANTNGLEKLGNKLKYASIEKLKKRVDDLIIKSAKNIVVFIDDIDRLDIVEIQYVFKLVKLVGDFPRTCYVLSFDDEMVSSALAPKYGKGDNNAGYLFLEKIIQIPLKIPKASKKALRQYALELVAGVLKGASIELNKSDGGSFVDLFDTAFLPYLDNPRLGIRYANTLSFSLPLLNGEVNVSNLMIVEGLKIFYPELYDFMRSNSRFFLTRTGSANEMIGQLKKEDIKKKIDEVIAIYDVNKRTIIVSLLCKLFPQLNAVYHNMYYTDDTYKKWLQEKKICSVKHFERYFSYTVLEGDISDILFESLLDELKVKSESEIVLKCEEIIKQYSASDFIFKLRIWEEQLDEQQSKILSLALAEVGSLFPIERDLHFVTTYAQSASLIARLIKNVQKEKQLSFTLELLPKAQNLAYAMEINYWLMYREKNYPENSIFSETDEALIQDKLLELFRAELNDQNFFALLPDNELWRMLNWWIKSKTERKALDKLLKKRLNGDADFALKLLKVFTPTITGYGSEGPKTYKAGFYQNNFDAVKSVVDVKLLNNNLITLYGMNPYEKEPTTVSDHEPIDDKTLISVFQWFINKDVA
jgi:predicted KAP-like P-loop ATPase